MERFSKLERYILGHVSSEVYRISYKQLNDNAQKDGVDTATEKDIRTLLFFLTVKGYTRKKEDGGHNIQLWSQAEMTATIKRFEKRLEICQFTIDWLYRLTERNVEDANENNDVRFSIVGMSNMNSY